MKNKFKYFLIFWGLCFALYIYLYIYISHSTVGHYHWTSFIATCVTYVGLFLCGYYAFSSNNNTKFFYAVPIINISYYGTIINAVFSFISIFASNIPNLIKNIIPIIVLFVVAIFITGAKYSEETVTEIDKKIKTNTYFIKNVLNIISDVLDSVEDENAKKSILALYEIAQYSDPVSNDNTKEIENEIKNKIECLLINPTDINLTDELIKLFKNRNRICKSSKGD